MEVVYREYFPDAPTAMTIEKKANLMLINSHPSMNPSMLLLPDMIEVGGMHCRQARSLPSVRYCIVVINFTLINGTSLQAKNPSPMTYV